MGTCPECGKDNYNDAAYCGHCGEQLKIEDEKSQFEKNMEHFGEEMEKIGKKIENTFENVGKDVEIRYDKTFGIFAPIITAFICFIFIFIVIKVFAFFSLTFPWMGDVSEFMDPLIVYILPIILISSFSNYLSKKHMPFRFISPIIGALVFVFWFWIAINILSILGTSWNRPFFVHLSNFLDLLLIPIVFLILIVGYVGVINATLPKSIQKSHPSNDGGKAKKSPPDSQTKTDYKRLYRSGNNRMVAGVLGGLAEYLGIDPTIIRVLFVVLLIASMGFMILAYLVSWVLIPRNPMQNW